VTNAQAEHKQDTGRRLWRIKWAAARASSGRKAYTPCPRTTNYFY